MQHQELPSPGTDGPYLDGTLKKLIRLTSQDSQRRFATADVLEVLATQSRLKATKLSSKDSLSTQLSIDLGIGPIARKYRTFDQAAKRLNSASQQQREQATHLLHYSDRLQRVNHGIQRLDQPPTG
jgi:hypothetical protein